MNEDVAIELLLERVKRCYGYDFSHYSRASLTRRLRRVREKLSVDDFVALSERLVSDEDAFDVFLYSLSITVTDMYRDPGFYRSVRENLVPVLKTFPFIKIWHAGCATGEEAYSTAILLHEEGFLKRARLYATDFNRLSLDMAEKAVYPARNIATYTMNYLKAGGTAHFSDYYSHAYDLLKLKDFLKENTTFSYHNLVTDGVFGEMNVVFCRNVLIYFDKVLQNQVLEKFTQSLRHGGFLCLGSRESLNFTSVAKCYEPVDKKFRIFRKIGGAHV